MANVTVGTAAVEIVFDGSARPLIQNLGAGNLYFSRKATVSSSNGIKLTVGSAYEFPDILAASGGPSVWVVADLAGTDVRYDSVG